MAARVSQAAVEVLRAGTASGRVSQVANEVLRSTAVATTRARVSQAAVEVLRADTRGRLTQAAVEVLLADPVTSARVSQAAVEVLRFDPPLSGRLTQAAAEVLLAGDPAARVTQVAAEVLREVFTRARVTQSCAEVLRSTHDEGQPDPGGGGSGPGGSTRGMFNKIKRAETVAAWLAKLTAWGATDEIRLFTNDLVLTELTAVADFTDPVGAWYVPADHQIVYSEPFIDPITGLLELGGLDTQYDWAAGGGAVEVDIWGWYVSSATKADWRFGCKFDSARHLGDALNSLPVRPRVQVPIVTGQRWP